jgi:predicted porin
MKKLLIAAAALAVVAGSAQAQSSVTVYGVLDKAYSNIESKVTSGGSTTTTENTTTGGSTNAGGAAFSSQNYTTERIGFRGTEDLGGGLKANFNVEFRLGAGDQADSGSETTDLATRLSWVGLEGSFGSVAIGRQTALMEAALGAGNSSNTNNFVGTLYTSGQKYNNSRSDRVITYTSPKMGAFNLAVQYGEKEVKTTTDSTLVTGQDEMTVNLTYAAGPLTAVLSHSKEEHKAASVVSLKPEATVFGANYNFGPATAFVTYAEGKNKGITTSTTNAYDREAYEVGVRVPMKAWTFQASVYDGEETVNSDSTKSDVSGYQLSALYNLSKRTNLYAVIGSSENKNAEAGTKTERDTYGVGIRHQF